MYIACGDTVISADIRSHLRPLLFDRAFASWAAQTEHPTFACADAKDLCSLIVASESREKTRCALALLSDALQFYSARTDGKDKDGFGEFKCNSCLSDSIADVRHALSCSARAGLRVLLFSSVCNELIRLPSVASWLAANAGALGTDFRKLMWMLFDLQCDVDAPRSVRLAVGAFSDNEVAAVMKRVGYVKKEIWLPVFRDVRLLLFEYVFAFWREMRRK
jgi:hypothetical protein